jgi:hypothetical protein
LIGSKKFPWLDLFLVPDYFGRIAEDFTVLDEALILLQSNKLLKGAVLHYFKELRSMREVKLKVLHWFSSTAYHVSPMRLYYTKWIYRGFELYTSGEVGRDILLWSASFKDGTLRIIESPAKAPEEETKLNIIPHGPLFTYTFEKTHQLQPWLNKRVNDQSSDLIEILDEFEPIFFKQLRRFCDDLRFDDNFDANDFDANDDGPSDEDAAPEDIEDGNAPVVITIEDDPEVITIEDDPKVIILDDGGDEIVVD